MKDVFPVTQPHTHIDFFLSTQVAEVSWVLGGGTDFLALGLRSLLSC